MQTLPKFILPCVVLLITLGTPGIAQAQFIVGACNMSCQNVTTCTTPGCVQQVTQCEAEELSCQAKYEAYDFYLTQMGAGVSLKTLPALYRDVLGSYYPGANLSQVRFGYSSNQPPDNATTDCDKIYFNDQGYVSELENGTVEEWFYWVLHELRHFEQCGEVGGRDDYAKLWWDDLSETELQGLIDSGDWDVVHDQMAMEQNADSWGHSVQDQLEACCIHPSTGRLIRPLQVSSMVVSPQTAKVGDPVSLSLSANHGAEPLTYEWSVRAPNASFFTVVASTATASFTPDQEGVWQVRARVVQATGPNNTLSNDYEGTQTLTVEPYEPFIADLTLSKISAYVGDTVQGTVKVDEMPTGATVNVALGSSGSSNVTMPSAVAVTAGSGHVGTATFTIEVIPGPPNTLMLTHNATITASANGSEENVKLKIKGVTLEQIEVSLADLHEEEWFEVRVMLDRPPPVSMSIALESSDARVVRMPRAVTFERGERVKTLRVQAGSGVTRVQTVTLRARMDRERQVETRVRVQPGSRRTSGKSN